MNTRQRSFSLSLNALCWMILLAGCKPSLSPPAQAAPELSPSPGAPKKIEKAQLWTCPMHPQVKQSEPGRCPICGMDLVKAAEAPPSDPGADSGSKPQTKSNAESESHSHYAAASHPSSHARFQLSLPQQQMIGVKTGQVIRKPLFKEVRAPGRVAFDPELYTAQSEYQEALLQLERVRNSPLPDVRHSAERMVDSSKLRLKILGLSDAQIAALSQRKKLSESQLLLPKSGESAWIYAEVYEMDLSSITPGLEAQITASFLKSNSLKGKVVSVDRILNTATRTARVRIELPEAKQVLRPETYVDATILAPLGQQLAVPFDAIFDTGKEAWVFIAEPKGTFSPRQVRIKFHAGEWAAIESGLQEGETIVTSANFLIDSESRLRGERGE